MATFNEMVEEVSLKLSGFTMRQDRVGVLKTTITATSTSVVVEGTDSASKGLVEIDDELFYVTSFAQATDTTLTVPLVNRGYYSTSAAAHEAGALVKFSPSFPRAEIKRAINDTILAAFPRVYGMGSTTFSYSPAVNTYALPSTVNNVVGVSYETIGASKEWAPIRNWRVDTYADPSTFGTSNTISLYSPVTPGSTVRVAFSCIPEVMENNFDDFSDTTGYADSVRDVIVLGACYRLLSTVDAALTQYTSPENQLQSSKLQPGSATNAAKYFYALYQQRLNEESEKLQSFNPVRVHFTR